VDLIPRVYDTERSIRVLGADGAEKYAKVNTIDPRTGEAMNDLSRGKYDVQVTVGPNMGTQRQEAAEIYMGLMQGNPGLFPVVGDLVVKTFDYPYSDEMAERLRVMAPPQVQQLLAQKEQQGGKPMDPRAQAAMAQAEQMMQQVQQMGQLVQQAEQELQQLKSEAEGEKAAAEKAKADVQLAIANLKVQEAELQSQIIQAQADLAQREMAMQAQGKDIEHAGAQMESQAMRAGEQNAVAIVQDALKAVGEQIKALEQAMKQQPPAPIVIGGGNRQVRVKRINGELVGESTEI
jgi:Phage P22-like portal protein